MTTLDATESDAVATEVTLSPYTALLATLRGDVTERIEWITTEDGTGFDEIDHYDVACQAADSCVPIYTHHLARLAADRPSFLTDTPEIGPAAEHYGPALRYVVANIFEHLTDEALDIISDLEVAQ